MIRSILVPIDGSPLSERAIPLAVGLAHHHGARIALVTVHEMLPPSHTAGAPPIDPAFSHDRRAAALVHLERVASRVRRAAQVQVEHALLDGRVLDELAGAVRDLDADLVVMNTHGRGGLSRAWLGSVAEGLLRRVTVPVLLTRSRIDFTSTLERGLPFRRVLVPLDGSPEAESAITEVSNLLGTLSHHLTLAHVAFPPPVSLASMGSLAEGASIEQEYLEPLAARLASDGRTVSIQVVQHTSPARALMTLAASEKSDLIALSTHGRGGMSRMLFGSTADKVIRLSRVPVLLRTTPGAR